MKQRGGRDVETRSSIRRIVVLKRSEAGNVGGRADTIRRIVVLVKQFLHRADMFAIADEWEIEAGACVRGKVHLVHLGQIRLRGDEVLAVFDVLDVRLAVSFAAFDNVLPFLHLDVRPFESELLAPLFESVVW